MHCVKKTFSTIGHFWTALSSKKCSPEHQDNTSQQKHHGKKLVFCTTMFSRGVFLVNYACVRESTSNLRPGSCKNGLRLFISPPPSPEQVFESMRPFDVYLMCLNIQTSRHLYCYSIWHSRINSWQQIDGLEEKVEGECVRECGEQKFTNKRRKGYYGRLQQKYVLYMCVHCSSLSVREREKRGFWPTWAERGQ